MKHMTLEECPVKTTVDIIGGKWKPIILYYLKQRPQRYGELQRQVTGITKKVLTQQLRELERDAIVAHHNHPGRELHVEYSLTAHGQSLRDVLEAMAKWGNAHRAATRRRNPAASND